MVTMQDPFRPNSNAQLMREAQMGFIVIGLLLCVLVYVAFYRLTNRSTRFDQMARNVAVAEPIDSDPYRAHSFIEIERKREARPASDRKESRPASETFSSVVKASAAQQMSSQEKVVRAAHITSQSAFKKQNFKKPATNPPPTPTAVDSGFVPVPQHISAVPRPFESRAGFDGDKESNLRKLPPKKLKVEPPVLKSEFGGTSNKNFLPSQIFKKAEAKNESGGFEASPPLPSKITATPVSHVGSEFVPPDSDSIDVTLTRQLPSPNAKVQSSSFMARRPQPQRQLDLRKVDFAQPDESSLIVQASALEPVKADTGSSFEPSVKREKISPKIGKNYVTKKGDSLWTIAQAVCGDGRYFRALHQLNHDTLSLSESIPAGTSLQVATIEELQKLYPELCPKQEKDVHTRDQSDTADTHQTLDEELEQRFYRTEDGDTLFEIARQRLGQASRYLEIHDLNRFRIPETANHLTPLGGGIQLLLPQ